MKRTRLKTDPKKARDWHDRSRRENPLRSGKGPERKSELSRGGRLRPVNPERRKRIREKQFGTHATWIRSLPCDLCGARPPSDPHHTRTRGAGGTKRHLIPACRNCHDFVHDGHGPSRETLMERAGEYWARSPHNPENAG